jgi:hypothetical protein
MVQSVLHLGSHKLPGRKNVDPNNFLVMSIRTLHVDTKLKGDFKIVEYEHCVY